MLQKLENLGFVSEAPSETKNRMSGLAAPELAAHSLVDADLLDLRDEDLQQAHDRLQRQLGPPGGDPLRGGRPRGLPLRGAADGRRRRDADAAALGDGALQRRRDVLGVLLLLGARLRLVQLEHLAGVVGGRAGITVLDHRAEVAEGRLQRVRRLALRHLADGRRVEQRDLQRARLGRLRGMGALHRLLDQVAPRLAVRRLLRARLPRRLSRHLAVRRDEFLALDRRARLARHPLDDRGGGDRRRALPVAQALRDAVDVRREVRQRVENVPLPNDRVNQIRVAVELVLDDVVEDLEQKEDEVVVRRRREQKPRRAECLEQMQQLDGRDHRQGLQVRGDWNERR